MTERNQGEERPGLAGQTSGEGGIRAADAAISTDRETLESSGELDNLKALERETAEVLVSVTRAMYPHDRIPDKHYARVVASLDEKASADERTRELLEAGVASLATLTGRWPREFGSLDESDQVQALRRIEDGPFFKTVASEVVNGLYSQHDVWPYFGYEGPSNDKGGYINRGFNDIDWLDDAPDYRGKPIERTFVDRQEKVTTEQRIEKEG
ncbi:Gluconate 2-dehydrogenase subunit 3 [Rubrobacter radiotolerans]|uniref:Gluconate 2-dehydrogenase subunit 3 n=1 Tax=Rubrobacter radiotolerans TaxID=42256 RepID=A0A023X1C0_RUBRA|nr:hypothetical protein [Rubrobacter radiotolerans]AHY45996.1 Gluconate 2-dehydrogenase subunit 3 [Rubrobacter radiotolerans]MDX5893408.1 hypothetical protein [Rubrobacter radiotolerans]SMC03671.1 hypothetical protein SAMN00767673_0713 [Rubrobacter radiotolerans DSM 5868]